MNISMPANFAELDSQIRDTYDEIWKDWFPATCAKAKLEVVESTDDADAKYFDEDIIQIPLLSADITDYLGKSDLVKFGIEKKQELDWKLWKASLVHETLHEYATKCITSATLEGISLKEELAAQLLLFQPEDKHPDTFYSAIYEKASHFGMNALEFAVLIK